MAGETDNCKIELVHAVLIQWDSSAQLFSRDLTEEAPGGDGVWVASPLVKGEGESEGYIWTARVAPSKPLTFILSPSMGEAREPMRFADAANLPPFRFREWKAQRQFLFVNGNSATRA